MKPLIVFFLFLKVSAYAQQTTVKDAFLEKWEHSKGYMLSIAEAMPDSLYGFRPTPRQMTFAEQLQHIQNNMDWLSTTYFTTSEFIPQKAAAFKDKKTLLIQLQRSFDNVMDIITEVPEPSLLETADFFAGPKSKLQLLNLLQDHVTHHRGQLIVYLNLNGIEPPPYVGW